MPGQNLLPMGLNCLLQTKLQNQDKNFMLGFQDFEMIRACSYVLTCYSCAYFIHWHPYGFQSVWIHLFLSTNSFFLSLWTNCSSFKWHCLDWPFTGAMCEYLHWSQAGDCLCVCVSFSHWPRAGAGHIWKPISSSKHANLCSAHVCWMNKRTNEQIIEKYRLESVSEMLSSNLIELQRREAMISLEP